MKRNYFLVIVLLALFCLFLIFFSLGREINSPVTKEPLIAPPRSPYKTYISGVGVVEASSENIAIAAPLNRIVEKVFVNVGDKVKRGEILLRLENRDLMARAKVQQASYEISKARLEKLQSLPRAEDLAIAEAAMSIAKTELESAKIQYEMVQGLPDPRAISREQRDSRLFGYQQAQAKWRESQANLEKVKSGVWKPDLEIAELEVQEAGANVERVKAEIDRTIIRSPINGTILRVRVHDGESTSDFTNTPMMIVGDISEMYLRVSINQLDIPFFNPKAPAIAYLQGDATEQFPLEFIRIEPYLISKQNLTNEVIEKVDTQVLQIIYRIDVKDRLLIVGQQMDAFIETEPLTSL